jgi:IS1 family transposase
MRKLSTEKRASILSALVEGSSINATARMCKVSKITVLRLLADAGQFCADYHDVYVKNLASKRVQADEIWSFCGCKDRAKKAGASGYGSVWTWVAMDADSKLCISFLVGGRGADCALAFANDIADRVNDRIQLTTDSHTVYADAIDTAFGGKIDYAQLVKVFGKTGTEEQRRYSPPECIGCRKASMSGQPDPAHVNTSYVERQNLTVRMSMRRMTRLSNGYSKKIENHQYATALHFFFYNFIRKHHTIKTTPAVAAGIANAPLTVADLVTMIEEEEKKLRGRLTNYLPPSDRPENSK